MKSILHITSGDTSGASLEQSSVDGEVFVWHDILYDGPRKPGWPDEQTLNARADFLDDATSGGLGRSKIRDKLTEQYAKLEAASVYDGIVLWFDACLFDQSMLCHVLTCLRHVDIEAVDLICIDSFPGIEPYHGVGQLTPEQLTSKQDQRQPVTRDQFLFAMRVDRAFALQDLDEFRALSTLREEGAPLPWIPVAVRRWLEEIPDAVSGLGRLERQTLEAIQSGCESATEIYSFVSERETPPQYWTDIMLWAKINSLAERRPPLARIEGPMKRLPQWEGIADLNLFRMRTVGPKN